MERRDALLQLTALSSVALAACRPNPEPTVVTPEDSPPRAGGEPPSEKPAPADRTALLDVLYRCLRAGEVCQEHCLRALRGGDTSLAACERAVDDMIAVVTAMTELAHSDSPHQKVMASVVVPVSAACEKECAVHATHHAECKACMEACQATIAAAKAV
ncbi:MAG: Csp1 family four helix bundle copper storage protein [Myxococcota bacterium]